MGTKRRGGNQGLKKVPFSIILRSSLDCFLFSPSEKTSPMTFYSMKINDLNLKKLGINLFSFGVG